MGALACDPPDPEPVAPEQARFRVTIENIAPPGSMQPSSGEPVDVLISPGLWVLHERDHAMLVDGEPLPESTEPLAEDGDFALLRDEMREADIPAGTFGAEDPGANYATAPLTPGTSVSVEVEGMTDERLSLLSMFIHSNDVLVATEPTGLALDGLEVGESADVTSSFGLFDAGTEHNEEPGIGAHQPMQGGEHGAGEVEDGVVTRIEGEDVAGYTYPAVDAFLRVTLERLE